MGNSMFRCKKKRKDSTNVKRLRKAIKLSQNLKFQKHIRTFSALFNRDRMKEIHKRTRRRVFTDRDKFIALSLYKQNPHIYRLLCNIYVLPPVSSLQKLSSERISPGMNIRLLAKLKLRARGLSRVEKMCVLMFDEVVIAPTVDCEQREHLRRIDISTYADHVVIFMIRLIFTKRNQPVAYKFSVGRLNPLYMQMCINFIISELQYCGFNVMATVCDQNVRNIAVINALIADTNEIYKDINKNREGAVFVLNKQVIVPMYDASQLIKGIRNDLIKNDLHMTVDDDVCVAKWDHIVKYTEGEHITYRLTKRDVDVKKMNRLDAECAKRTMSEGDGGLMMFRLKVHIEVAQYIPAIKDTIIPSIEPTYYTGRVMKFFGELNKSMSGGYTPYIEHTNLRRGVTRRSVHRKLWKSSAKALRTARFIDKDGKKVPSHSLDCWIQTVNNARYLSSKMFNNNIRKFFIARFNMYPLQEFIRRIRLSYGCYNIRTYEIV
ncbi:transposable element P transposase [Bicyclus anynana]|uniref:Transposable element P transposase n=1 Tax=Bicyclus anynana TaxID=110368 RepID=A0ABM3M300_BICAN|nr:transposable element P transposase [Bicyclus anynana]